MQGSTKIALSAADLLELRIAPPDSAGRAGKLLGLRARMEGFGSLPRQEKRPIAVVPNAILQSKLLAVAGLEARVPPR
jgi:hypothetical protein